MRLADSCDDGQTLSWQRLMTTLLRVTVLARQSVHDVSESKSQVGDQVDAGDTARVQTTGS